MLVSDEAVRTLETTSATVFRPRDRADQRTGGSESMVWWLIYVSGIIEDALRTCNCICSGTPARLDINGENIVDIAGRGRD
jgi:hypothetical protein